MHKKENFAKGKVVLGIFAHPDDLEFGSAGTVAKLIREGTTVYYLVLTDGSKGSENISLAHEELRQIRHQEQEAAAKVLGIKEVFFLDYVDGELENTAEVRQRIVRVIRQVKPDIVITLDPSFLYDEEWGIINHPDHRAAGQAALDAVFPFARNVRSFVKLLEEGLPIHQVTEVLLNNFQRMNYIVDISETMEVKLKALSQHKSQHDDSIKVKNFMQQINQKLGKKIGVKYAEGFIKIELAE